MQGDTNRFSYAEALIDISEDNDLSGVVDMLGAELLGVITPADFETADLSFQGSIDGVTYFELNDEDDTALSWAGAVASHILLKKYDTPRIVGIRYLKIATSVAQTADRVIGVLLG